MRLARIGYTQTEAASFFILLAQQKTKILLPIKVTNMHPGISMILVFPEYCTLVVCRPLGTMLQTLNFILVKLRVKYYE